MRCSHGRVYDVVVDLRPGSPAYRTWESFELDGDHQTSVFIPPGCAHGFQALTETADTAYRIDRRHEPSEDLTIAWNDPELAVEWPLPPGAMSENDREGGAVVGAHRSTGGDTSRARQRAVTIRAPADPYRRHALIGTLICLGLLVALTVAVAAGLTDSLDVSTREHFRPDLVWGEDQQRASHVVSWLSPDRMVLLLAIGSAAVSAWRLARRCGP